MTAQFGPFAVDPGQRRLSRDGDNVHLTQKAFDLLALLVDEAPRVVRKAELHERQSPHEIRPTTLRSPSKTDYFLFCKVNLA